MQIGAANYRAEFVEVDHLVASLVIPLEHFIDDLLQLRIFKIFSHHQLQSLDEIGVREKPILVHVINLEGILQPDLPTDARLRAKDGETFDELFEVDFSIAVGVESVDDAFDQRIFLQSRQGRKFIGAQSPGSIGVQFPEAFLQPPNFIDVESGAFSRRRVVSHFV